MPREFTRRGDFTEAQIKPGAGQAISMVGGLLDATGTVAGSTGGAETTLYTYSLPGNTLIDTGRGVRLRATGTYANNANAKTLRVYFGADTASYSLATNQAGRWALELEIIRTGANAQAFAARFTEATTTAGAVRGAIVTASATQADGNANVIKVTGEADTTNDLQLNQAALEFL
jgi:hypothetical protein